MFPLVTYLLLMLQQSHSFGRHSLRQQCGIAKPARDFVGRYQRLAKTSRNNVSFLRAADGDEFWKQQKAIMEDMTGRAEKSLKQEQLEKFASRRTALIGDTALFTTLIFSLLWVLSANPFVSISYAFGATFGLAYAYGLGKYVETLGGSADDTEAVQGAGIGQARFAFLIMLFVLVGRFRSSGLIEIPSIAGFFTYQLASLSQGLREIND